MESKKSAISKENKSTSIESLFWAFLEQGGSKAVSLCVQIVLARLLDPEAFGVLAILLVVTNIADAIAQSGLGSSIVQREQCSVSTYSTAFWLSMGVAVLLFVLMRVTSPMISHFYGMEELGSYLSLLSIVVFFNSANSIQRSILQRSMDFRNLFITSTTASLLSGAIGVASALAGWGVWALIVQVISQSAITCFVMAKKLSWKPSFQFEGREAWSLFSYGWKIAATSLLNVLYTSISDLTVGRACSTTALGYYSQGRKYPMAAITVATNAIQNVMFPSLARKQGDHRAFVNAVKRALATGTFLVAPLALFCTASAQPIVELLLTEKWSPCVPIFQMVCISHSVMMLTLVNLRAYMAVGRSDLYLKLQIVKVTLSSILICGTAVFSRDIYITSFATCLSTLFNILVIDTHYAKATFGYSAIHQIADIAPTVVLAAFSAVASYALSFFISGPALLLILQMVMYWAIYFVGARLLRIEGLTDGFSIIKSIVQKGKVR